MAKKHARHHLRHPSRRIRQIDVDFLCLAVFGQRALPDDMACRIAEFRDAYMRGLGDAFDKARSLEAGGRLEVPAAELEAVAS